ncbi:MAG: hypothetical protein J6V90_08045 [Treponema sp.]|nr:hypothetical protein [Treponema sp.]
MKSNVYAVIGKKQLDEKTKRAQALIEFIRLNFNDKSKRLGFKSFVKEFGKFNEDKKTLLASSVVSVNDIQAACRYIADKAIENNEPLIPALECENNSFTIAVKSSADYAQYYQTIKPQVKKETDYTKLIIDMINKHSEAIQLDAIQVAIDALK